MGSTIRSALPNLTSPEIYVQTVLKHLWECEREVGEAQVRLDVGGLKDAPHYLIEAVMDLDTGQPMNWQAFNGKTHRPLSQKDEIKAYWSSEPSSHHDISLLLGELRNFTPKRR